MGCASVSSSGTYVGVGGRRRQCRRLSVAQLVGDAAEGIASGRARVVGLYGERRSALQVDPPDDEHGGDHTEDRHRGEQLDERDAGLSTGPWPDIRMHHRVPHDPPGLVSNLSRALFSRRNIGDVSGVLLPPYLLLWHDTVYV